jgi:hypothetical protein
VRCWRSWRSGEATVVTSSTPWRSPATNTAALNSPHVLTWKKYLLSLTPAATSQVAEQQLRYTTLNVMPARHDPDLAQGHNF